MKQDISIAIETSCRAGGVALGRGDRLEDVVDFDASRRHAAQLVSHLDGLLRRAGLGARDLNEVYVSAGPGSFTGLRVGITVARTLAQSVQGVRCVAVPTPTAVAENLRDLNFNHLAVIMDAREDLIYATFFQRRGDDITQTGPGRILSPQEFLDSAPRPLTLAGEGLEYHELSADKIELADPTLYLPTAEGVWRVGRRMATAQQFTDYNRLLPVYTRKPKALRQWNAKQRNDDKSPSRRSP